jgi:hypothetical protein
MSNQESLKESLQAPDGNPLEKETPPKPVAIQLLKHENAPFFSTQDGPKVFQELLAASLSGRFSTENAEIRELLRQAGFVSLWFFLKVIAAYNGPYERLTNHLHVDLANNYQRFMVPGRWSAFFLPRSTYKSTLVTYGANAWELLRNPNLSIAMGSAIADRAYDFMHETQRVFDSNEFFAWLYPEYIPEKGQRSWNDKEMTLPNRTRRKVAPSIQVISVGASSQGIHSELLKLDDIVGDAQLTSDRGANADMRRIGNWFRSNIRTLVDEPKRDRVVVTGTRYSIEDPYEYVMDFLGGKFGGGWQDIPKEIAEGDDDGWYVYYRQAIENNKEIFPEKLTKKFLRKIREDDPWNYLTQYLNNPYTQEVAELSSYVPEEVSVDYSPAENRWVVEYGFGKKGEAKRFALQDCDVVIGVDPAATEKGNITAKTSRSSLVVLAFAPDKSVLVLEVKADYVGISQVFDWMFAAYDKWNPRITCLEMNGPFKILEGILINEQDKRQKWISLYPARARGDKVARIRSSLEPILRDNRLFLSKSSRDAFMGELISFPNGKKDVLDAFTQAFGEGIFPEDPLELEEEEEKFESMMAGRSKYTGY